MTQEQNCRRRYRGLSMTAVTGLSVLYYKSPPYKKTAPHHRCGLTLSINRLLLKPTQWNISPTSPRTNPSKTALSIENRQHSCLLMNALPVSQNVANRQHPCLPSKKGRWHGWYNFFACCTVFRYSCLYNSETIPSRDGGDCECVEAFTVALPSFQSLTPCTNPPKTALYHPLFVMPTSVCADTLSNSHYPIRFS